METQNQLKIVQDLTLGDMIKKAEIVFDFLDVSEETRKDYQQRISPFLKFIKSEGINVNTFLEYKRLLKTKINYAVSTKNKLLVTAKIFLKELNRQGFLQADITQNIKTFKQFKGHKREGLNQEEIDKLTTHLKSLENTKQTTRLKAIFSFLILQGMRQIEITRLKVGDIDLANKTAFVLGKGRDDKEIIHLHPETVRNIEIYLKVNKLSSGFLFHSKSNRNKNSQMTTQGLRQIIKNVLNELGITKHVHGFRNFFVSKLIKNYGGDLLEVARYTRHRSLEMLQIYNDNIKQKQDLPRYYETFEKIKF